MDNSLKRPRSVALAWYRAEDYAKLRAKAVDGHNLPVNHDQWRLAAEQIKGEVQRSGRSAGGNPARRISGVVQVRQLSPSGSARSRFANEQL
jgi:hypothetical protein